MAAIGINGFGRMGRLALRAGWAASDLEFAHVNEPAGDVATAAHQVKVLAWYDNEWGYANRLVELAGRVARQPLAAATSR